MRKVIKIMAIIMAVFSIYSCGSRKQKEKDGGLTPYTTTVSGDLADCFKVVDREYKATDASMYKILTVEMERTDAPLPFDVNRYEVVSYGTTLFKDNVQVGFGIEFRDKDGNVLDKVSASGSGFSGSYSSDDPVDLIKLRPGETGSIRFTVHNEALTATQFKMSSAFKVNNTSESGTSATSSSSNMLVLVTGTNVRLRTGPGLNFDPITDASGKNVHPEKGDRLKYLGEENDFYKILYNDREAYISQQFSELISDSAANSSSSSNSRTVWDDDDDDDDDDDGLFASSDKKDWTKFLDSYEEYVDSYISFMKKAASGDLSALSEYPRMLSKAEKLQKELTDAKDDMSVAQWNRYMKITNKMTQAALNMAQ